MDTLKLQNAHAFLRAGDVAGAERLCAEILVENPADIDALHLCGVAALIAGAPDRAAALFEQALALRPQEPALLENAGLAHLSLGNFSRAESALRAALQAGAGHGISHMRLGLAVAAQGRTADALPMLEKAAQLAPDEVDIHLNLGNVRMQSGQGEAALKSYERAVALAPGHLDARFNHAVCLLELGRHDAAAAAFEQIIAVAPGAAEAHAGLGRVLAAQGHLDAAIACFDRCIALQAEDAGAHFQRADLLRRAGRLEAALAGCERTLALNPAFADALNTQGNILQLLKRDAEAVRVFDRLIALRPELAEPYFNRGRSLRTLGQFDAALENFALALARSPDFANAHFERANLLRELGRYGEAIGAYDQLLQLAPDRIDAWHNRGAALLDSSDLPAALDSFDRALKLQPDAAETRVGRGNVLQAMADYRSAIAAYEQAIALKPELAAAHYQLGQAWQKLGAVEKSNASYEKTLQLDPDYPYCRGLLYFQRMQYCDWAGETATASELAEYATQPQARLQPLVAVAAGLDLAAQKRCAERYVQSIAATVAAPPLRKSSSRDRVRVAYLSPDFRQHAVSNLTVELFEVHDRAAFEVIGVSFGADDDSALRRRVATACDRFIDVTRRSDSEIAALLREMEIDVAVDLCGHTLNARTGVFALRPAPVQVNYLGYPGTLGAPFIDYLLADAFLVPAADQMHYAEQVVYLPDCYQVNDRQRVPAAQLPSRSAAGLPAQGFVFCCFNNSFKITPDVFELWMRLLHAVEGSVIWLLGGNADVENNLRREAAARGIAASRLIFAPRVDYADYLARYKLADLFLDTLPFNAGTTASDALWVGLPVLTCAGRGFSGRVAGSMLNALRLPELVTANHAEYEALALRLARDPAQMNAIRQKLAMQRTCAPLFNVERTARHIECAYRTMVERWRKGEPPRSFAVPPLD